MTIIDTHAHLDHLENLDEAIENAVRAGVEGIVAVSVDINSCHRNLEIKRAKRKPVIFLGMGMHPSEANLKDLEGCLSLMRANAGALSAVGEIGLDFWHNGVRRDDTKKDEQRKIFQAFLEFAREFNLPAVIHSRGAWRECFEMARLAGVSTAVFHWYSGPLDVLEDILAQGYYVSATPSLAYNSEARRAMARAPVVQTLIETDCPVFYRNKETGEGFQAEPKDVFKTLRIYCALKGIEESKAVQIFNQNARHIFDMKG